MFSGSYEVAEGGLRHALRRREIGSTRIFDNPGDEGDSSRSSHERDALELNYIESFHHVELCSPVAGVGRLQAAQLFEASLGANAGRNNQALARDCLDFDLESNSLRLAVKSEFADGAFSIFSVRGPGRQRTRERERRWRSLGGRS
jgi:hypothetical protein